MGQKKNTEAIASNQNTVMKDEEQTVEIDKKSDSSIWSKLLDALMGSEADYTKIPLRQAIFLLAVPMILELVLESVFAVVDMYYVGQLGPAAITTVGITENYLYFLYAIAMGLSMGITAIVARRFGEKDREGAVRSATQAIFIALFASLPFAILGIVYSKSLLGIFTDDPWILEQGYPYCQWMLGGNAVIMFLFVINAIFRGAGDAALAMWVLTIANVLNLILDPLLIFGIGPFPELGITGAAVATNIGRGIGVIIQLYILFVGGKRIKLLFSKIRIELGLIFKILKTSIFGIAQMFISMLAWFFLMMILTDISTEAAAASTIVIRLMMLTLMPAWGLSNAAATLVGQNLGANDPKRAEKSVWIIGLYNMVFLILVSIAYNMFDEQLVSIFTNDATVISIGSEWVRILSYSYFIYGWWMVSVQAFNGAGDTITPTWINIVFFWMIQIPLAYFLAYNYNWSYSGVFWSIFVSESMAGIFTLWLFKRGRWKRVKV